MAWGSWRSSLAVIVLLGAGCSQAADAISADQAKNSACLHASGAVVSVSGKEEPVWAPVIEALEIDLDLLAEAGDDSTAETVGGVIDDLRSGVMQPLEISIYLRDDISQSDIDVLADHLMKSLK